MYARGEWGWECTLVIESESGSRSVVSDSLQSHAHAVHGQTTGVRSLSFLQGNLPNPGIEPRSPTLQADSLSAEPQGSPRILEWVAYSFSRGSSQPRNRTWGLLHGRQILYQLSYQGSPLLPSVIPLQVVSFV